MSDDAADSFSRTLDRRIDLTTRDFRVSSPLPTDNASSVCIVDAFCNFNNSSNNTVFNLHCRINRLSDNTSCRSSIDPIPHRVADSHIHSTILYRRLTSVTAKAANRLSFPVTSNDSARLYFADYGWFSSRADISADYSGSRIGRTDNLRIDKFHIFALSIKHAEET